MAEIEAMKPTPLHQLEACSRILPSTIPPVGELFTKVTGARSSALLCLDPLTWSIRFFGVDSQEREKETEEVAEELKQRIAEVIETAGRLPKGHGDLFELIGLLLGTDSENAKEGWSHRFTWAYRGAVELLEKEAVRLGNAAWSAVTYQLDPIDHWKSPSGEARETTVPLTRFQEALDLAALYDFDISRMRQTRDMRDNSKSWPESDPTLVIVDSYTQGLERLIGTQAHVFVAEHIQALGRRGRPQDLQEAQRIDSYFMPIRGLGQWRAAFDCKCLSETAKEAITLRAQASVLARAGLEDLFTSALINAFTMALHEIKTPEERFGVFASLWWSRAIRFYRQTEGEAEEAELVGKIGWRKTGDDKTWHQWLEPPSAEEARSADGLAGQQGKGFGRSHPGWLMVRRGDDGEPGSIVLDFRRLRETPAQRSTLLAEWGFDRVEYECDLLACDEEDFHRWADTLGNQLVAVRRSSMEQVLRRNAELAEQEYSKALFAFGHHLGNLFLESGIATFTLAGEEEASHQAVKLERIKARLLLAWGIGEAIRPMRHSGKGYPSRWFDPARPFDPDELARQVQGVIRVYLGGLCNDTLDNWWVAWELPGGISETQTLREIRRLECQLPSLYPFGEEPTGTLAVTLGLAEQLRNAREHWCRNNRAISRVLERGEVARAATIQVIIDTDAAVCQVVFDSVLFYRRQEGQTADERYRSSSIEEIHNLEAKALGIDGRRVVETSQPRVLGEEKDRLRTARSTWTYNYGAVRSFEPEVATLSLSLPRQGA